MRAETMVMKTWSGWLDWGLLAAALVVSTYIFWGWWFRGSGVNVLKKPQEITVTETVTAFPERKSAASSGLVNPLTAPAEPGKAIDVRQVRAPAVVQASAIPVQSSTAAASSVDPFWISQFSRDPTLSPKEIARMVESRKKKEAKPAVDLSVENRLAVQGTVQSQRGVAAIINGERKSVGDSVFGAVILSIDDNAVLFEYKGRRFTKKIGK